MRGDDTTQTRGGVMQRSPAVFLLAPLAALLWAGVASAVTVDGRVTASAYAYEGNPTESTTSTYVRSHVALRLAATDLGWRGLSLSTYALGTTDLAESADSDPQLRVHNLFLRYQAGGVDVRAGRQHLFAGVGYGTIDGARVDARHAGVDLTLYGGALAPVGQSGLGSLSAAHMVGARLSTSRLAGVDLAVSFTDRQRDPEAFADSGRFSRFIGQPSGVHRQLVGAEAHRGFGRHSLRGRLDVDLLDSGVRRAEVAGRLGLSVDLAISAEVLHREPAVYEGSFLSVFPGQPYDEVELGLHYRVAPALALSAYAATVLYDGDDSQRLGLSAACGRNLAVSYYRAQGFAGAHDGLSGSAFWPVGRDLVLRGELGLSSYERFAADDRDGLASAVAGLTWRPTHTFSLDGQLQALRNPSYDSDLRALVRGSWRFRQ